MIDIKKAKQEFKNYVKNYDYTNPKVKLKIVHIERTAQMSKEIAKYLQLSEEDISLAELIGLLHDIGRFEQIKRYNTFIDKNSINHGEFGVEVLFKEGLIRKFVENNEYDEIIKKAILNHNRNKDNIDKTLTERELLHTKIIRDSDKLDIYRVLMTESKEAAYGKEDISNEKITDEIYNKFITDHDIDYKDITSHIDVLVAQFAYAFDINYKYSLNVIKENNYINRLLDRFEFENEETLNRAVEIRNIVNEHLKSELGEI